MSERERLGMQFWPECRRTCPPGRGCPARQCPRTESVGERYYHLWVSCPKRNDNGS